MSKCRLLYFTGKRTRAGVGRDRSAPQFGGADAAIDMVDIARLYDGD